MDHLKITRKLIVNRPTYKCYFTDEWYQNVIYTRYVNEQVTINHIVQHIVSVFHGIGGVTLHDGECSVFFFVNRSNQMPSKYYGHLISYRISRRNIDIFYYQPLIEIPTQWLRDTLEICNKNLLYCFSEFQESLKTNITNQLNTTPKSVLDYGSVDNGLPPGVFVLKGVPLLDQVRICARITDKSFSETVEMLKRCSNSIFHPLLDELRLP